MTTAALHPVAASTGNALEGIRALVQERLRPDVVRIDTEGLYPKEFLHRLGAAGGFESHARSPEGIGAAMAVMEEVGGTCGSTAFLVWCQDACVWYLANTANEALRENRMTGIASGERLGATALSNPMKFFSGIEELKLKGKPAPGGFLVSGGLPWVSNLGAGHAFGCIFDVDGESVMALVDCNAEGLDLNRTAQFAALEGTATFALRFRDVFVRDESILARPAQPFAKKIRPGFVLLQLGMGFGIIKGAIDDCASADRSLESVNRHRSDRPEALRERLEALREQALTLARTPLEESKEYIREVFRVRLKTAELALAATQSALLHSGARGFIASSAPQRRCREAMFFAILTPSIKHLRMELARS